MEALPTDSTGVPSQAGEATALLNSDGAPRPYVRSSYVVVSVERSPGPDGSQGSDWCRYVLSCGSSRIMGLHRGTLEEVSAFAASSAEDFNTRAATGKGKAGVAYTKKKTLIPSAG